MAGESKRMSSNGLFGGWFVVTVVAGVAVIVVADATALMVPVPKSVLSSHTDRLTMDGQVNLD